MKLEPIRKSSIYSEDDGQSHKNMINMLEEHSLKDQDIDISIESCESEFKFPNTNSTLHIKLVYDKNKFLRVPTEIEK